MLAGREEWESFVREKREEKGRLQWALIEGCCFGETKDRLTQATGLKFIFGFSWLDL